MCIPYPGPGPMVGAAVVRLTATGSEVDGLTVGATVEVGELVGTGEALKVGAVARRVERAALTACVGSCLSPVQADRRRMAEAASGAAGLTPRGYQTISAATAVTCFLPEVPECREGPIGHDGPPGRAGNVGLRHDRGTR